MQRCGTEQYARQHATVRHRTICKTPQSTMDRVSWVPTNTYFVQQTIDQSCGRTPPYVGDDGSRVGSPHQRWDLKKQDGVRTLFWHAVMAARRTCRYGQHCVIRLEGQSHFLCPLSSSLDEAKSTKRLRDYYPWCVLEGRTVSGTHYPASGRAEPFPGPLRQCRWKGKAISGATPRKTGRAEPFPGVAAHTSHCDGSDCTGRRTYKLSSPGMHKGNSHLGTRMGLKLIGGLALGEKNIHCHPLPVCGQFEFL